MTYRPKRMPSHCYDGAPPIVRQKIAFICANGCGNGVPFDIIMTGDDGHGNAVGLDIGDGIRGQHFFLTPTDTRNYRAANSRKRRSWQLLPEGVQQTIIGYLGSN